jgi:hypothetical protein
MNSTIKTKQCQFDKCKFESYYCYLPDSSNNSVYCLNCVDTLCKSFHINGTKIYIYCEECKIIFRYDETNIHHNLYDSGKLFYAEIIDKYIIINDNKEHSFDFCPKFDNFTKERREQFIELYKKGSIIIKWKSVINQDDCCVCLEPTNHYTECKHHVCCDCVTKLHKNECPMCKLSLRYKNINVGEDYNSDSDSFPDLEMDLNLLEMEETNRPIQPEQMQIVINTVTGLIGDNIPNSFSQAVFQEMPQLITMDAASRSSDTENIVTINATDATDITFIYPYID